MDTYYLTKIMKIVIQCGHKYKKAEINISLFYFERRMN